MTAMMVGGGAFGGGMGVGRGGLSPPTPPSSHPHKLPSPHSPPSPASSDSPTSPGSPGRSQGNKACGVCGDIAKSMHFGGLSCDSCKAFFRRSVQNNAYKGFTCPYEKKCVIAVSSRKACQYCRFNKCLAIGMEKGWVMTEDERRKMMQQRQEKKHKEELKKQTDVHDLDKYTLPDDAQTEISIIVSLYKKAYQDVPYEETCTQEGASGVMVPWMTFYKRIAYFFSLFREFTELPSSDQALLLKTAITSAGIIMGSIVYDSATGKWPGKGITRSGFIPQNVTTQNVERVVPADMMNRVSQFFRKFQQVCPDETMGMILILVALYSPELMGLVAKDTIQQLQDRYTNVLHSYVKWKYREKSALMFPKVIVSLADIRELAELTSQIRIQQGIASNIPNVSSLLSKTGSMPSSSASSPMETNQEEASTSRHNVPDIEIKEEAVDYGELLQTPTVHKRARLDATGGKRDHTYQKIMEKVMEQMQGSSLHLRVPSLLPCILEIVKKVGSGNNLGASLPPAPPPVSKVPQHQVKKRCGPKRRLVEIKQEKIDEDFEAPEMPNLASPVADSPASLNVNQNVLNNHQNLFNLPLQQHPNLSLPQSQEHLHLSQQPQCVPSPGLSPGINYPASPMESTDSYDMLPPSPLLLPNSRLSPMHVTAQHHMSNQPSDMLMPTQVPHMAPVAPYTPPSNNIATSPMPLQQPGMLPMSDMPLPSPMAAPSPYSDTSSSSPESSQSPLTEIFTEELTDVEIDVLTQLLSYFSTIDNLDNVSNLKEIIPAHLLDELQRKLSSYSLNPE